MKAPEKWDVQQVVSRDWVNWAEDRIQDLESEQAALLREQTQSNKTEQELRSQCEKRAERIEKIEADWRVAIVSSVSRADKIDALKDVCRRVLATVGSGVGDYDRLGLAEALRDLQELVK